MRQAGVPAPGNWESLFKGVPPKSKGSLTQGELTLDTKDSAALYSFAT